MKKPNIGVLLDVGMKNRILGTEETARLRRLSTVQFEEFDALDTAAVKKLIRETDGIITGWGTPLLTGEILSGAPKLKIIAHAAGSVKPVCSEAVWERNIRVTSAAASIGIGVAEYALGLLITGLKRVHPFAAVTRGGGWASSGELRRVREFYKTTIGVVGAGFVGRRMIKLLRNFDVTILLFDPFVSRGEAKKLGVEKVSLNLLLKRSDAVTLHAPSLPSTRHMMNEESLSLMKENAVLVNTARGALIDEKALVKVLRAGKIFTLLDVTDPEPPAKDSPLRTLKNVVLTPHIAGAVADNCFRQGAYAVTELERFFSGKAPLHPVTRKMLGKIA